MKSDDPHDECKTDRDPIVSIADFAKISILTGTVVRAEEFSRAKNPSYKVWVDFGPTIGVLQTSAQVTVHYTTTTLIGRQVLGCTNLGPRNIAGFTSQFLLLGFCDVTGAIRLAAVETNVPNGMKLH